MTLLKPATSSESSAGGANLPDAEGTLTGLMARVGLQTHGALSLPWTPRFR